MRLFGVILALSLVALSAFAAEDHWVATWATSLQGSPPQAITVKNQTVRQRLEISVGGPRLRLHVSNEYGSKPLVIGAASSGSRTPTGPSSREVLQRRRLAAPLKSSCHPDRGW